MNLTTKGRYAVMAMVDIASQADDRPVVLGDIATRQNIKLNYLEQIFMKLRKAELVQSVRGPGGGYMLAKSKRNITVAHVVIAVEESIEMTRCGKTGEKSCMQDNVKCATHHLWAGLAKQIFNYLDSISLADLCNRSEARQVSLSGAWQNAGGLNG